jgi:hypothetical protein
MDNGTWNIRSLYTEISMKTVESEIAKCNLDLVAVKDVRWVKVGSQPEDDYAFLYGSGNVNHHLGTGCFVHNHISS